MRELTPSLAKPGPPLAAALVLLFVPVGVPAAGGPFGPVFITSWYAHLGTALPAGAAMPAIRDVISFGGQALAVPLLVLCLWAGISAIVLALPLLPPPRRRTELAEVPADVGAGLTQPGMKLGKRTA